MITEAQIRKIAQEEIRRSDGNGQFKMQNIPLHTHNSIDSTPIFSPTLVYTGAIPLGAGSVLQDHFLPTGWKWEFDPSGFYTITHNLGTRLYSVVVSKNDATGTGIISRVSTGENQFFVFWYDSGLSLANAGFFFTLVQINNKTSPLVPYTDSYLTV